MTNAFLVKAAPLLPWPLLAALFVAALLLLAIGVVRRARGVLLRGLAFATLLAALLNPSLIEEKRLPQRDVAVVVVDQSPSQSIGQRRAATEKALEAVARRLSREKGLALRVVPAGASALAAASQGTRLFHALDRTLSDVPRRRLAGVVMITDGQVADAPSGNEKALRRAVGAPLYVLLSGQPNEKDRRLIVTRAPRFGIVGKKIALLVRVEEEGESRKQTRAEEVRLSWRKDGGPLHRLLVPVGRDIPLQIAINHGGANVIELQVAPGPQVLTPLNKEAVVVVNGVRDRLKVLLVSGKPTRDERVWRNILKSDPSVDLVHFTILRPPEKQDATPIRELSLIAFPTQELFDKKLKEFDLVIFEEYDSEGIIPDNYLANVARYVRSGGAFLEVTGPPSRAGEPLGPNPLDRVLPAKLTGRFDREGFRPRLTVIGRRHPVTAGLPGAGPEHGTPRWGRWFRQEAAQVRHGVTLMTGAHGEPLLVLDRVGKGRVAELLSDAMWLWARGFEGGGPQAELLRRLVYWLMKEPALSENALRARVERNRLIVTRQSLEPDNRPVTVTIPDGAKKSLVLTPQNGGRSSGSLPINAIGLYHVSDGERTAVAAAGPLNPIEFADVRTTARKLAPVAAATGGRVFWVGSGKIPEVRRVRRGETRNGNNWMGFRENGQYRVAGFGEIPLLPGIVALFLILGGLLAAWRREGS
jgi:hypothetical protein